ncbi:MAG TPA: carboxypeptidase-like regulatory domain-containing protein [Pyrinomonadaceae bacterium]|nr:carboxypeptidase-like regulatory domain-containing protein [Pyrinomonadaceae bacterium]
MSAAIRRIFLKSFISFAIVAAAGCLVQGQESGKASEVKDETKSGMITGRVVNESGQPLSNAVVIIRPFATSNVSRNTLADAEGNFQITGLDTALYALAANMPAYVMPPREPDAPPNFVRVGDNVKLTLIKGGVLTGTVTNSNGDPVIDVQVHAQMVRDAEGKPKLSGLESGSRNTDDRGVYRIYGLAPGTYVVFAGVSSSFGFGLSAYESDIPTYAPSSTRDTATEIQVRSGDEITGIDIRYRGEPGRTISGSVIGAGAPDSPTSYTANLAYFINGKVIWNRSTIQQPNLRGFAFNGLADGDYEIWGSSFVLGDVGISEIKKVKVKGANITGIELSPKPLASVAGQLTFEPSKAEECKDKRRPQLAETMILTQREPKPAPVVFERFINTQSSPGKDGTFTLRNLSPGSYAFTIRFFAKYWYLNSMSIEPAPAAKTSAVDAVRNWTVLKLGDRVTGLNIKLSEGAASLHGQLKIQNGQTIPEGLSFYLVPAEREKSGDVVRFYGSHVNADGSFVLNNLAPGRYFSVARIPGENEELWKLSLPEQLETRNRLRREAELARKEVEFKLCENKTGFEWAFKDK